MLEPRYTVRTLADLLQLSPGTARKYVEAGELGRYWTGRRGLEVSQRGLTAWLRRCSQGELGSVEPFFALHCLAAVWGCTQRQMREAIEAGDFGPFLTLPSRELRVPMSGLVAYDAAHGIGGTTRGAA